ncbi:MAG: UDP-N-acetylenolpyruvoylglucosamine reductase [Lachnospiraceae bacterium]|nr:UDP-N-acetylenolpyruvoylglucosamine reductase [Lachnospiraceae bacterium]
MTALRQGAIMELEKLPEDKLGFMIQIMQGVNGLYTDTKSEKKEAYARLEQLRRKGTVTDDDTELVSYEKTKGCIAAHSISNMFFILRKD